MEIVINLKELTKKSLCPDEYVLLYLMYHKDFDSILALYGAKYAIKLRAGLTESGYILDASGKFTETKLSNKHVEKLLHIRTDKVNFWEFYNCYPVKVGSRILRSAGPTSQVALKHEKKYLARIKTEEQHKHAVASIEAYVAKVIQTGKQQYLPNMETVMNNSLWEQWGEFIQPFGAEGQDWNSSVI